MAEFVVYESRKDWERNQPARQMRALKRSLIKLALLAIPTLFFVASVYLTYG